MSWAPSFSQTDSSSERKEGSSLDGWLAQLSLQPHPREKDFPRNPEARLLPLG